MAFMLRYFVVMAFFIGLAGCSLFPDHRLDYQSAQVADEMQLPPGADFHGVKPAFSLPDNGPLLKSDNKGKFVLPPPNVMASIEQHQQEHGQSTAGPAPKVEQIRSDMTVDGNGYPMIMIHTSFDWSWEYVADALDKSDFHVRDKDRKNGAYLVRLSKKSDKAGRDVRVVLSNTTNGTQVVAMDKAGKELLDKDSGRRVLAAIYAGL